MHAFCKENRNNPCHIFRHSTNLFSNYYPLFRIRNRVYVSYPDAFAREIPDLTRHLNLGTAIRRERFCKQNLTTYFIERHPLFPRNVDIQCVFPFDKLSLHSWSASRDARPLFCDASLRMLLNVSGIKYLELPAYT